MKLYEKFRQQRRTVRAQRAFEQAVTRALALACVLFAFIVIVVQVALYLHHHFPSLHF